MTELEQRTHCIEREQVMGVSGEKRNSRLHSKFKNTFHLLAWNGQCAPGRAHISVQTTPRVEFVCIRALQCSVVPVLRFWHTAILLHNIASNPLQASLSRFYMRISNKALHSTACPAVFFSLDCYANESLGHRCDLQVPTQRESPVSELSGICGTQKVREA